MKQLLWLGLSLLAACSRNAPPDAAASAPPSTASAPVSAATNPAVEAEQAEALPPANEIDLLSLFGAQIQLAPDLPANDFRGDFTGDGIEDRAFLIRSSTFPPNLAPDIQLMRPFQKSAAAKPANLRGGSPVTLVLVNGGPSFPSATIIMHDAAQDGRLATAVKLGIRLLKPAELAGKVVAAQAKGDVLVLPGGGGTEDCFYWDGTTYRFTPMAKAR